MKGWSIVHEQYLELHEVMKEIWHEPCDARAQQSEEMEPKDNIQMKANVYV